MCALLARTNGYRYANIATGTPAIMKLGAETGFDVDTTTDLLFFRTERLEKYAALIFLSTTGKVFDQAEEDAFEQFIYHHKYNYTDTTYLKHVLGGIEWAAKIK